MIEGFMGGNDDDDGGDFVSVRVGREFGGALTNSASIDATNLNILTYRQGQRVQKEYTSKVMGNMQKEHDDEIFDQIKDDNKVNVYLEDTIQNFINEMKNKRLAFDGGSINQSKEDFSRTFEMSKKSRLKHTLRNYNDLKEMVEKIVKTFSLDEKISTYNRLKDD